MKALKIKKGAVVRARVPQSLKDKVTARANDKICDESDVVREALINLFQPQPQPQEAGR